MSQNQSPSAPDGQKEPAAPSFDWAAVKEFVAKELAPNADQYDQAGYLPQEVLTRMCDLRLWGAVLPLAEGGSGLDTVSFGTLHEEISRGDSSVRNLLTVHSMVAASVSRWGDATQREQWLPDLASGAIRGAFGLSEPQAGSDTAGITATAQPRNGNWVLNGHKKWITGARTADLFLMFALVNGRAAAFLVPRDTPGLTVVPISGLLGARSSMLGEVLMSDVVTGPDALLGPQQFGAAMVMNSALDVGRFSVASGSVGIAQGCLDACADYTAKRTVRGRPIRELQLIRAKLADMVTDTRAARQLCEHAGRLKDAGDQRSIMATWIAKYFASKAAARIASDAVQIHGANGCGSEYPVQRYFRDAKLGEIVEGSSEIQQLLISDEAFR